MSEKTIEKTEMIGSELGEVEAELAKEAGNPLAFTAPCETVFSIPS